MTCRELGKVIVQEQENRLGIEGSDPIYAHIKRVYAVKKKALTML